MGKKSRRSAKAKAAKAAKTSDSVIDYEKISAKISKIKSYTDEEIDAMTDEQQEELHNMLRELNSRVGLGTVLEEPGRERPKNSSYYLISRIDVRKDILVKQTIVEVIAYLRQCNLEWGLPPEVPIQPIENYSDPNCFKRPEPINPKTPVPKNIMEAYDKNEKMIPKRLIVDEFLNSALGYDPNRDVHPIYRVSKDKLRKPISSEETERQLEIQLGKAKSSHRLGKKEKTRRLRKELELIRKKLKEKKELEARLGKNIVMDTIHEYVKDENGKKVPIKRVVAAEKREFDNMRKKGKMKLPHRILSKSGKVKNKPDPNLVKHVTKTIPPRDLFIKFRRYRANNYDKIRQVTFDLFGVPPEIDTILNIYGKFPNKKACMEYMERNKHSIKLSTDMISDDGPTIISEVGRNRECQQLYGEGSHVIAEYMESNKQDLEFARDVQRKRVYEMRKKTKQRSGKHSKKFKKLVKTGRIGRSSGLSGGTVSDDDSDDSDDEKKTAKTAKATKEKKTAKTTKTTKTTGITLSSKEAERPKSTKKQHIEMNNNDNDAPEDAIGIEVIHLGYGGLSSGKKMIYTQAEAPDVSPIVK